MNIYKSFQPFFKPLLSNCFMAVREMATLKHKKMIKMAKGYRGRANRCYTVALQKVHKALQYSYRDRKV